MTAADAMGPPLLDRAPGEVLTRQDFKGDDAIDFYLVAANVWREGQSFSADGVAGKTVKSPIVGGSAAKASAFVLLPVDIVKSANRFHTSAIHEFFHVLQFAHNAVLTGSNWWYVEATARWAEAHFDRTLAPWTEWTNGTLCFPAGTDCPRRGAYHEVYRPWFVGGYQRHQPSQSLITNSTTLDIESFIWPYFMEQQAGSGSAPMAVWGAVENLGCCAAADAKIDSALPFRENFRKFAQRDLNLDLPPALPESGRFVALDPEDGYDVNFGAADGKAPVHSTDTIAAVGVGQLEVDVVPLAAQYQQVSVQGNDVRQIVFDLHEMADSGAAARPRHRRVRQDPEPELGAARSERQDRAQVLPGSAGGRSRVLVVRDRQPHLPGVGCGRPGDDQAHGKRRSL